MTKKDISEDSVEVFTWNRHGERLSLNEEIAATKDSIDSGFLKKWIVARNDYLSGKILLDAGCGGGNKTIALAMTTNAKIVIGIDGSESAIVAAKKLAAKLNVNNVLFLCGFIEDIPMLLNDNGIKNIDFIFNSFNLHHVEDYPKVLSIYSNIIKPGSYLLTIFTSVDRGLAGFVLKNRIAYHLGKNKEQRKNIGKFLFGWYDKKYNKKAKFTPDSFFADRYSAFYRVMLMRQVYRRLREVGFEVIQTNPPMNSIEFLATRKHLKKAKIMIYAGKKFPYLWEFMTIALRIYQFFKPGDTRGLLCIKTNRGNLR